MSLHHFHYLNLTRSIVVSVQSCDVFVFVKQLSKDITKFHGKNISALSARRILSNGGANIFASKLTSEPNNLYVIT